MNELKPALKKQEQWILDYLKEAKDPVPLRTLIDEAMFSPSYMAQCLQRLQFMKLIKMVDNRNGRQTYALCTKSESVKLRDSHLLSQIWFPMTILPGWNVRTHFLWRDEA